MKHVLPRLRRATRWLGPVVALLLGSVLVLGSTHHHPAHAAHDACVICTAAQAPAVTPPATVAPAAPVAAPERSLPALIETLARLVAGLPSTRGPPTA